MCLVTDDETITQETMRPNEDIEKSADNEIGRSIHLFLRKFILYNYYITYVYMNKLFY